MRYILMGHEPCHVVDMLAWVIWMGEHVEDRVVARDVLMPAGIIVSTVFLGLDHNWNLGRPMLFETMVFGGTMDKLLRRYESWDTAVIGHAAILAAAMQAAASQPTAS